MAGEWQAALLAAGAVASAGAGVWTVRTRSKSVQRARRMVSHEQVHIPILGQEGVKRLVRLVPSVGGAVGFYLLATFLAPGAHYLLALYVAARTRFDRLRKLLREQTGMVGIEYFVFAAFVVLLLVGVYMWMGPELGKWMKNTITCLIDSSATNCGSRSAGQTLN